MMRVGLPFSRIGMTAVAALLLAPLFSCSMAVLDLTVAVPRPALASCVIDTEPNARVVKWEAFANGLPLKSRTGLWGRRGKITCQQMLISKAMLSAADYVQITTDRGQVLNMCLPDKPCPRLT